MRIALVVLSLFLAGCTSTIQPDEEDLRYQGSVTQNELTTGIYQLEAGGFSPYVGNSVIGAEGSYSINHLSPFQENSMQMWAIFAIDDTEVSFDQNYQIFAAGPAEQAGEGNEVATNACPSIGQINPTATQFFVNRTLGKPAHVAGGLISSVSSSGNSLRIFALDAGGSGHADGTISVPAGSWYGVYGKLSQVHPANIKESDFMFSNLTIDGAHALVTLPSAPWVCRATFNAANEDAEFVQTALVELQMGGTGGWFSPYGSFMVACGEKNPTQLWFPRDRNSAMLSLGGSPQIIGEGDIFFEKTLEAVDAEVQVSEWWGYPRFTYGGIPYDFMIGPHDCEAN